MMDRGMDRWMDGWMDGKIILLHPYHAWKLCSKFEYIPSSGLGGACMMNTDRWTAETTTIFPPIKDGDYILGKIRKVLSMLST